MPESSRSFFLIKRSIYNPWTLSFSYQFIFKIPCCFLKNVWYFIDAFNGYLPERFEALRNFFRIRILLSAVAVFSLILFSGIFVKSLLLSPPFWTIQILKVIEDYSFRPFFSLLIRDLVSEVCPKFQNTINASFSS